MFPGLAYLLLGLAAVFAVSFTLVSDDDDGNDTSL
jgi:hypothetical protein